MSDSVIIKDPDILGGMPVFRGTRVPVKTLLAIFETGMIGNYLKKSIGNYVRWKSI